MTFRDRSGGASAPDFPAAGGAGHRESTVGGYPEVALPGYRNTVGRLIFFAHVWLRRTSYLLRDIRISPKYFYL